MRRKRKLSQVNLQKKDMLGTRIQYETKGRQKTNLARYINEETS